MLADILRSHEIYMTSEDKSGTLQPLSRQEVRRLVHSPLEPRLLKYHVIGFDGQGEEVFHIPAHDFITLLWEYYNN